MFLLRNTISIWVGLFFALRDHPTHCRTFSIPGTSSLNASKLHSHYDNQDASTNFPMCPRESYLPLLKALSQIAHEQYAKTTDALTLKY